MTNQCRICYDNCYISYNYCKCSGSIANIHRNCLIKWITSKNSDTCEICHSKFNIFYLRKYINIIFNNINHIIDHNAYSFVMKFIIFSYMLQYLLCIGLYFLLSLTLFTIIYHYF